MSGLPRTFRLKHDGERRFPSLARRAGVPLFDVRFSQDKMPLAAIMNRE